MAHAHELSKEIQAFCQENLCATSKEVRAKFPNAKAHQISYARTQAKGKKGTGKVTRTTRVGPMPAPPPERRKTGEGVTMSAVEVMRLLQIADDKTVALMVQVLRQQ